MFVLDTNVISELRRPEKANARVLAWASSQPLSGSFISSITILEIELGTRLVERRDQDQAAVLRAWIDHQLLPRFEGRVLPVDTAVAQVCAGLHVPDPRPDRDALIAATALAHGMAVVTRNASDFEPMGVPVIDPWAPA